METIRIILARLVGLDGTQFIGATCEDGLAHLYPCPLNVADIDTTVTATACGRFLAIRADHTEALDECRICAEKFRPSELN